MLPPSIRPQAFTSPTDCSGGSSALILFILDAEIKFVLTTLLAHLGMFRPGLLSNTTGTPVSVSGSLYRRYFRQRNTRNAQPPWIEAVPFYCELRRFEDFLSRPQNRYSNVENR
jgi:hypothetical protein